MKALESLLVHLDAGTHAASRLRAARALARRLGGWAQVLYAVTPSLFEMPFAMDISGALTSTLVRVDAEREQRAHAAFEMLAAQPGAPLAWSFASPGLGPIQAFVRQAHYADLLLLGQHDARHRSSGLPADFVVAVAIASGRPALVLPNLEAPETIGERVMVAWKETAQSARAVAAALPLLAAAREVHVACWGGDPAGILRYLGNHGIDARAHAREDAPAETGELMLSLAAEVSADLLVMGCYGHSRAREFVLGGASRTILRSMTLPVLMVH